MYFTLSVHVVIHSAISFYVWEIWDLFSSSNSFQTPLSKSVTTLIMSRAENVEKVKNGIPLCGFWIPCHPKFILELIKSVLTACSKHLQFGRHLIPNCSRFLKPLLLAIELLEFFEYSIGIRTQVNKFELVNRVRLLFPRVLFVWACEQVEEQVCKL